MQPTEPHADPVAAAIAAAETETDTGEPVGAAPTPAADPAATQDDIDILMGERSLRIDGRLIAVKELTFQQEMALLPQLQPLLDALGEVMDGADFGALEQAFATHYDAMVQLMATCTGQPIEWFAGLRGEEGHALLLTTWTVNKGFFLRRLVSERLGKRLAESRAGQPSGPH